MADLQGNPDEVGPFVCECCPRVSDAGDADTAIGSGWSFTFDGWICPVCTEALIEEDRNG